MSSVKDLRIGVYANPLAGPGTGIALATGSLVRAFSSQFPGDSIELLTNRTIPIERNLGNQHCDTSFARLPGSLWLRHRLAGIARRAGVDVLWLPVPFAPRRAFGGAPIVMTVYDLVWQRFPKTTTAYNLLLHRLFARASLQAADIIVVPSRSTAGELESCGVPKGKIRVVPLAASPSFRPGNKAESAGVTAAKYKCSAAYLCGVGTLEPRKNLITLLRAIRILRATGRPTPQVLIAGMEGWRNAALKAELRRLNITRREVLFLGYVPDDDLVHLYRGAIAFVFPSLYEGFGLPPLEALASGTPVISSSAPCMPEVLGDAAVYFPPDDAAALADRVAQLVASESWQQRLRDAGLRRAGAFSWTASACQLRECFEEAIDVRGRGARGGRHLPPPGG